MSSYTSARQVQRAVASRVEHTQRRERQMRRYRAVQRQTEWLQRMIVDNQNEINDLVSAGHGNDTDVDFLRRDIRSREREIDQELRQWHEECAAEESDIAKDSIQEAETSSQASRADQKTIAQQSSGSTATTSQDNAASPGTESHTISDDENREIIEISDDESAEIIEMSDDEKPEDGYLDGSEPNDQDWEFDDDDSDYGELDYRRVHGGVLIFTKNGPFIF